MTLQPNNTYKTSADAIAQISSYFDVVDNCIQLGDTNHKCRPIKNSINGDASFDAGTYVNFLLSPTCDNTADISTAFIQTTLKAKVWTNTTHTYTPKAKTVATPVRYFVGFKDAFDAVLKYELIHNGISKYTQNNATYESYITGCSVSETTKKSDFYSKVRHKDVFNAKNFKCGTVIDFGKVNANQYVEIEIPLKIDVRRFLPFSNMKYFPQFEGKLEIRVLLGIEGLVVCPVDARPLFRNNFKKLASFDFAPISNEFVQLGDSCTGYTTFTDTDDGDITALGGVAAFKVFVDPEYGFTKNCSVVDNLGIADFAYNSIYQRYKTMAFSIPTQTLEIQEMSNILDGESASASYSHTPRFVDTIFLLFPIKYASKTVIKNPNFTTFELECGGYGTIPSPALGYHDPRELEFTQQALHCNTDQTGLRPEIVSSIVNENTYPALGNISNDCTNYIIGFKVEPNECFQQGQTTNSPIDYKININQKSDSYYKANVKTKPRIAFLNDRVLSFQIMDTGEIRCALDAADITTPQSE